MIWTSYYGKYRGTSGLCVSNSHPDSKEFGLEVKELFPDWDKVEAYKNGDITWKEFRKAYIKKLKKLDVHEYAKLCNGHVLLCWEKDPKHCHRSILVEWFTRNGYLCGELEANSTMGTCLWCKNFKGFSTKNGQFEKAVCTKTGELLDLTQTQCHTCDDWRYSH